VQIGKYDKLLREAEERREAFKRRNIGLMPKDGANYFDRLQEGTLNLEQAKLLLAEARNRREQIQLKIAELVAGNEIQEVKVITNLDIRIETQEVKVDELLLLYTDEHPDVINARLVLESLKTRKLDERQNEQIITSNKISNNPVYQELQILLAGIEGDISSFSTRVAAMEIKQSEIQKLVDIVPKIETELQRLNRDYEVHQNNYTQLVARREKARISEDVESGGEQVTLRVIEPPYVPSQSVYPDRVLLDLGALAAALAIGYGISLLVSLFQPVFYSQNDMRNTFATPILGSIRKFDTPEVLSKRRRNLALFSIGNTLLICLAGYLMHLHNNNIVISSHLDIVIWRPISNLVFS
jgi:polysaccharide chain length determinant protein (PEP-CTERM system associated)